MTNHLTKLLSRDQNIFNNKDMYNEEIELGVNLID